MGDLNAVAVARAVELRWTGGDWWWQGQVCWWYSGGWLAVVVEWQSSVGGGGGGVAVVVAHKLKVRYFSAYLYFFLSRCIETTRTNHIYPMIF